MENKTFNFILFLVLISGCAYYSKTDVSIQADKAQYPMGISAIKLEKGTINIHREMSTKGLREDVNESVKQN